MRKINRLSVFFLLLISGNSFATPQIETWITSQGAKVMYVHAPDLPMVDMRVVFDGGSARDGDNWGVANMTNSVLTASAGEWDADALAKRLENVGAQLGSGSLKDMAWMSMRSLTDEKILNVAVETLNVMLTQPRYDQDDMERIRKMMLATIIRSEQSPGSVGQKRMMKVLYEGHPYASPTGGNQETVKALTVDHLKKHYQQYYVAKNATLVIVGAVDRQQAEMLAERLLKNLPAGEKAKAIPAAPALAEGKEINIEFPSTQSHLFIVQPGTKRGDQDYFVLHVGNHILGGGGFASILVEEVREKRGLAYSAYSAMNPMKSHGPFMMGAQTKNSQAEMTVGIIKETLQKFIDEGPTDEQLTMAKQKITGSFPLRYASNSKITNYLAMIGFYDLPVNYLDEFVGKIEAVTKEQIKEAFQRRIHPDKLLTVVVGAKAES